MPKFTHFTIDQSAPFYLKSTSSLSTLILAVPLVMALGIAAPASAADDEIEIEEVIVTGSYIRRKSQSDSPSPVNIMDASSLSSQGISNISDIARHMTFNAGAEINTDSFTQNFSAGTANVNLRGLGLSSTLVLLNGKRQTLSSAYADDGSTFVDTNTLMPMIMLSHVETLKDGGAAIYGTDAVAGVVNYITRSDFVGFEIQGRAQTTTSASQRDYDLSAIFGTEIGDGRGNFVVAANFTKRTGLEATDRSELTSGTGISIAGQPGTIFIAEIAGANPIIDPGCGDNPNSVKDVLSPATASRPFDIGFCRFDFSDFYSLVPEEERIQTFSTLTYDITDTVTVDFELGYAKTNTERNVAPSFPIVEIVPVAVVDGTGQVLPWVPEPLKTIIAGYNASLLGGVLTGGNAAAGDPPGIITGVGLLHRPLGGVDMDPTKAINKNSTFRFAVGVEGELGSDWFWDVNFTYSKSDYFLSVKDTQRDAYTTALLTGTFNPFSTNLTTYKNSQEAIDAVIVDVFVDGKTSLYTIDAVISGDLMEFGDGVISAAYGMQYRKSTMSYDWSDSYNAPSAANVGSTDPRKQFGGNLMFLYGGADFNGSQDVYALFAELAIPLGETIDIQLAGRYENYGGGVNSFDPKISILWRPNDILSVRGSFSTAFRAPSLFNTIGQQTSLAEVQLGGSSIFIPATSYGNADLAPEEANIYNIGATWELVEGLTFSADYWRFEFSNLITQESSQAVLDLATTGDAQALSQIQFGTFGDFTSIQRILTNIINAPTVTTDGFDMSFKYSHDTEYGGNIHAMIESTYVFNYDATDAQGNTFDGAGSRNFTNFARSIPKIRANMNIGYIVGNYSIDAYLRHIHKYYDDQNEKDIPCYTTVDLQASYLFGEVDEATGLSVTLGVINLFDKDIPRIETSGGFDSKVHDPRQRMVYLSAKYSF